MSQATPASISYTNSNLFSGYYLDERVDTIDAWDCDEDARAVFEELQTLWNAERDLVDSYNEDELLGSWIDPVLAHLGYDSLSETTLPDGGGYNDRLLFDSAARRREAASEKRDGQGEETYRLASALLEAKQWDADFTERFAEERSYRDASHQVKYYLERTPDDLGWGILTNGRTWRLYGTKDYETSTYYEVDLPHLLESGDLERFKYFYVFFRPAAFRGSVGETFLDRVWAESESAAQQLGEDLQNNVFTALSVLGTGFAETNSLSIDPGDTARLDELKEQSLVLLYRLMFVLYAESRDLIDPDDAHSTEYEENFSLDRLRREIVSEVGEAATERAFEREYSTYATGMWSRLEDLFSLIDKGNESLGIPPYNGGLFDEDTHDFLVENEVADRYLAEVIYRLSTTETDEGFVPAEYADLDTRHLGSIYEGLLEHEFRIASEELAAVSADGDQVWKPATEVSVADAVETVEQGELYVVNDDGERKATGAYYTPDYVVTYIVEETLGPLVQEIDADLRGEELDPGDREYFRSFWQRVTDLKVLDPAMGSGHFLTRATGYLTEQVMSVVREQEIQSYGEDDLRRQIAKECIYGVDLNGMAVELAKLSMWLETLAADQPLAFLDHHLKTGNSLVGSDITEVLSDGDEREDGQLTFAQVFARTRKRALEHVMELMEDLLAIDNETLADVKSMEEIYDEIRADPLYRRLFEMADVHTAEHFGVEVPGDAYERMARAIEDDEEWAEIEAIEWFREAQDLADEENFFHWELEFPEVFFGGEGSKREEAGFDAVIGNPPWGADVVGKERRFVDNVFPEVSDYESAQYFMRLGSSLISDGGQLGNIVPNTIAFNVLATNFRTSMLNEGWVRKIVDYSERDVFGSLSVRTMVLQFSTNSHTDVCEIHVPKGKGGETISIREIPQEDLIDANNWARFIKSDSDLDDIISKIEHRSIRLEQISKVTQGYIPYRLTTLTDKFGGERAKEIKNNREWHSTEKESEDHQKELQGSDVERFSVDWSGKWIKYGKWVSTYVDPYYFTGPRLLFREITSTLPHGLFVAATEEEYYHNPSIVCAVLESQEYDLYYLLSLLNSSLISLYFTKTAPKAQKGLFPKIIIGDVRKLPIRHIDFNPKNEGDTKSVQDRNEHQDEISELVPEEINDQTECDTHDCLADLGRLMKRTKGSLKTLNLSLLDHLGNYDADGPTLTAIGFTQPPAGAADSILHETAETRANLRVGSVEIDREGETTVTIHLTARYKPNDEGNYETDRWGYTETDLLPALRITDLRETEADLIGAFVPVAVKEAGGFAGFRETATKTNSLIDRLEKLTLPVVSDVESGLNRYIDTRERAEELEEKIERTDRLIDEIVYELYGLTDEEIEIVEEAVGGE